MSQAKLITKRHVDETRSVTYSGHLLGCYAPVRYRRTAERSWRYISVNGQLGYAFSEGGARQALMECHCEYR
jgi:hypothetical protein